VLALDLGGLIQALLYVLFAGLTAIVEAVVGPTYDQLLVPELARSSLYPVLSATASGGFLTGAAQFSTYLVAYVVDPAVALVAVGVAALYLARSLVARWAVLFDALLPRLVISVVAANFAVPIAGAVLGLGGALYPVIAGWDGGAWQHWINLDGIGGVAFSWDNGALALVLSFVEFLIVLGLVLVIGFRDAMLAVLLVLLPVFTLLWPLRPLAPLARRAWLLFAELTFLPCVLVVPLELAVGSPNVVLLVGFLAAALGSPYLLSVAGAHLGAFGFPASTGAVATGIQRGLVAAPSGASGYVAPLTAAGRSGSAAASAIAGAARVAGSASAPAAAPLAVAHLVGHASRGLLSQVRGSAGTGPPGSTTRWPAIRGGGPR
jgi:hypothetical protein